MFALTSRYAALPTHDLHTARTAAQISYVSRRFLPQPNQFDSVAASHGHRQATVSTTSPQQYLDDPQQFWRICDANDCVSPFDLTAAVGSKTIDITLPQGIPGPAHMLKGIYLSLFIGPMVPPFRLPRRSTDALISAQVNTGGQRSGFQLVFSDEQEVDHLQDAAARRLLQIRAPRA